MNPSWQPRWLAWAPESGLRGESIPRRSTDGPDERSPGETEGASTPHRRPWAARIFSRVLGAEFWLVPDRETADAFRRELEEAGDARPVWTVPEVLACEPMLEADLRAIHRVKATFPGSILGQAGNPDVRGDA